MGSKRKYRFNVRRKDHTSKVTSVKLRYDVEIAIKTKEQELGISRSELINNALWTVFCNSRNFYAYEMKRHLMNAEVYRHKLEADKLMKEVKQ